MLAMSLPRPAPGGEEEEEEESSLWSLLLHIKGSGTRTSALRFFEVFLDRLLDGLVEFIKSSKKTRNTFYVPLIVQNKQNKFIFKYISARTCS